MARDKSPFNYLAQLEKNEERGLFEGVSNPLQKTTVPFAAQAENNTQVATQPAIGTQKQVQDWDVNELLDSGNFISSGPGEGELDPSGWSAPPTGEESTIPGSGIGDPDWNPWDSDMHDDFADCYAQWEQAQESGYDGPYNEYASYYCGG